MIGLEMDTQVQNLIDLTPALIAFWHDPRPLALNFILGVTIFVFLDA